MKAVDEICSCINCIKQMIVAVNMSGKSYMIISELEILTHVALEVLFVVFIRAQSILSSVSA